MELKELINNLQMDVVNFKNVSITDLTDDSREVKKGSLFVALKGNRVDGKNFIEEAIKKGAVAILTEENLKTKNNLPILISHDIKNDILKIGKKFYDDPFKKVKIIGVTGTNGKTTTTFLIKNILDINYKTGLIGTIKTIIDDKEFQSINTTPNTLTLLKIFKEMVDRNVNFVVMEVSSHGLKLKRINGMNFDSVVFMNLTHDHLDFHKTMEDYRDSKLSLFSLVKEDGSSIINLDDKYAKFFVEKSNTRNIYTFGIRNKDSRFTVKINKISLNGSSFIILDRLEKNEYHIETQLIGEQNIYNITAAFLVCLSLKMDVENIIGGIKNTRPIKGRFEIYHDKRGFNIIIDYAHTPDSLERLIKTIKRLTTGKVITVFGCGGDRDKEKRPLMGKIASHLSNFVIITSDNPRTEDPFEIVEEIVKGISENNYIVEINRSNAIKKAFSLARENDSIIIAGKGHENYQIIGNKKYHFDDAEMVKKFLK